AESPYVESRPFRVNAGAVHAYIRTPGGETKYLSELQSGDQIQIVDTNGNTREAIVGRAKIEKRPMFRIQATVNGDTIETLLQNAETIKVETKDGATSVTELETGDQVKVFRDEGGRHFGESISERIMER
ncbi:MAG: 3-dehydroquinate synthase II, partial [Halobacteriaceae archaeon]